MNKTAQNFHPIINELLKNTNVFEKMSQVGLRLPMKYEIGQQLVTYVKDGDVLYQENVAVLTQDSVVARNPQVIGYKDGKAVFHEIVMTKQQVAEEFSPQVVQELTYNVAYHYKRSKVKAVKLTKNCVQALESKGVKLSQVHSGYKNSVMPRVGDYLTEGGGYVPQQEMRNYQMA